MMPVKPPIINRFLVPLLVVLLTPFLPVAPAGADHESGGCNTTVNTSFLGALNMNNYWNWGSAATIEWDEPLTPCPHFSVAWTMSVTGDIRKWIQAGYWKSGTDHTTMWFEFVNDDLVHRRDFVGVQGTGDLRFVVFRNWSYSNMVWSWDVIKPATGERLHVRNASNITTPMAGVQFLTETKNTGTRLWGKEADRAAFYDLH